MNTNELVVSNTENEVAVKEEEKAEQASSKEVSAAPGGISIDAAGATVGVGSVDHHVDANLSGATISGPVTISGKVTTKEEKPALNASRYDNMAALSGSEQKQIESSSFER